MNKESVSRGQFLKELGLSGSALMAFYCLGSVTACKAEDTPAPAPNTGTVTPPPPPPPVVNTKVDFTLDLKSDDYKKLKTAGAFIYKDNVIVANVKGGTFVALSKACTHEGITVAYRLDQNDFWCSLHGSEFGPDGKVEKSPAAAPLTIYKTELKDDILKVTE
jgi:cytochrome b6-f complex iron-sulfur subunit